MWTASMPSTPTPRRMSSDRIRADARLTTVSATPGTLSRSPAGPRGVSLLRSLHEDAQTVRLQHALEVLSALLVGDPQSSGHVQEDANLAVGSQRAAQVVVEAAMTGRDDQQTSQLGQGRRGLLEPEWHVHRHEHPRRGQEMVFAPITTAGA